MLMFTLLAAIGFFAEDVIDETTYKELESIRTLYEANRNEFRTGRIRFRFVDFRNEPNPDTLETDPKDSIATEGIYEFDQKTALYTQLFTDDDLKRTIRLLPSGGVANRLHSFRMCTNYRITIGHDHEAATMSEIVHSVAIDPGAMGFYQMVSVPLDLGFPDEFRSDFGRDMSSVLKRNGIVTLVGIRNHVAYRKSEVTMITLKFGQTTRTYYVDLDHGCIPLVCINQIENRPPFTKILDDIRFISSRGWLPHKLLKYSPDGAGTSLSIIKVDFKEKLPIKTRFDFQAPVEAYDRATKVLYRPKKSWDISNLPSPTGSNSLPVGTQTADEPVMPGEAVARPPYLAYCIAVILIMMLSYGLARQVARRRNSPRSAGE